MRYLLLVVFSTFMLHTNAQNPTFQWVKQTGNSSYDFGRALDVDASGNVYTISWFNGTIDADPGAGVLNFTTSGGGSNTIISKLDPLGNLVWARVIEGYNNSALDITMDGLTSLYITGSFQGTNDFDPGTGIFNLTSSVTTDLDAFLLKLDLSGNFIWVKKMGGADDDNGNIIARDASGNVFLAGSFQGTADLDPSATLMNFVSSGFNDIFISKFDPAGNLIWAKQLEGYGFDVLGDITTDISGNVVITGPLGSTIDFDPGTSVFNLACTSMGTDVFILKLNTAGVFVWAKQLAGNASASYSDGSGIASDAFGNVFVTGSFDGTFDFDPNATVVNISSAGGADIFISKLDASGNFVWIKTVGSNLIDRGESVFLDASGNIYTTGYFQSTVDFDPNATTFNLTSFGDFDAFISKLDASGNFLWTKQLGGTTGDYGHEIKVDGSSNIYTIGNFFGTGDFNPDAPVLNLTSAGLADVFVHKMSQCASAPNSPTNITTITNQLICANNTTTLTATSTGTVSWYSAPTAGSAIATGTVLITTTLGVGTYTYYAETFDCSVSANRTPITVTVSPSPTITITSATICIGQQTATLTATGATNYTWVPSVTLSSSTGSMVTSSVNATQQYTVLGANTTGCPSAGIATVVVNSLPILTVNSSTICLAQETATLIATGALSYSWNPSSNLSSSTGSIVTGMPLLTESYTVTGLDINGCRNTVSTSIVVVSSSTITVANASVCAGQQATLTASGASSYTWTPSIGLSSPTGSIVTTSPSSTQQYTVYGSSGGNCSGFTTFTLTVLPLPIFTVNSSSICLGQQTATLTATGATSYTWNPSAGLSSVTGSVVTGSPLANQSYTISGSDANGCVNTATSSIRVYNLPVITASSSSICAGQGTATLIASGALTYTWLPSVGLSTTTGSLVTGTPTSNQTYSVIGIDGFGCINISTTTIIVKPLPLLTINNETICVSNPTTTLVVSGALNYTWSPSTTLNSNTGSTNTVTTTTSQNYTIQGQDAFGCLNTVTVSVSVVQSPTITVNSETICLGQQTATLTATGATSYTWVPNTGLSSTSGAIVAGNPLVTQIYTVTGLIGTGCANTVTTSITVNSLPLITATGNTVILLGQSAQITAMGGLSYNWLPNDGSLSCTTCSSAIVKPLITTEYIVKAYDALDCWQQDTVLVKVEVICGDFFIPNVFSPNGDGLNESVNVHGACIKTYRLQLFNRWGELVFETTDMNNSWDGTFKGKPMDTSVFGYKVTGQTIEDKDFNFKGNITLLR